MDTTVAQWESSVNTIPKLPMGYKSPMIERALAKVNRKSTVEFYSKSQRVVDFTFELGFLCV